MQLRIVLCLVVGPNVFDWIDWLSFDWPKKKICVNQKEKNKSKNIRYM